MGKINLERIHKIALARLISDLIEADLIVEEGEMDFFEKSISKDCFNISESMLVKAKKMDFVKAMSILKGLDEERRTDIVGTLQSLASSDGICVPLESILIYSVIMSLTKNANVYSVPAEGIDIDNMTVIYVENDEATETDAAIQQNIADIESRPSGADFDFIYIPNVVDDFRRMKKDYMYKVVKYTIPSVSSHRIEEICQSLCYLNTLRFPYGGQSNNRLSA